MLENEDVYSCAAVETVCATVVRRSLEYGDVKVARHAERKVGRVAVEAEQRLRDASAGRVRVRLCE